MSVFRGSLLRTSEVSQECEPMRPVGTRLGVPSCRDRWFAIADKVSFTLNSHDFKFKHHLTL